MELLPELIERMARRDETLRLLRVQGAAGAYLTALLRRERPGVMLLITQTSRAAERAAANLVGFLRATPHEAEVRVFPRLDTPPYDRFSAHPELECRRMSLLYRLLSAEPESPLLVVAPWSALLRRVLPRSELRERVTHLERGITLDRDRLLDGLVAAGYHHASIVEERGEVAARGGIVDLFPPQLDRPVRLEFDFDTLGSIRPFDPQTQRSEGELRRLVAIPPRSYRLPAHPDALIQHARALAREQGVPESNLYAVIEPLARRRAPPGIEGLESLLHERLETLFDYLPQASTVLVDDPEAGLARAQSYTEEIFQGHSRARHQDRLVSDPLELYLTADSAWAEVTRRRPVLFDALGAIDRRASEVHVAVHATDHRELRREITERRGSGRALDPLVERLARWKAQERRVRICAPTLSAAERLCDILRDYGHELGVQNQSPQEAPPELLAPGAAQVVVASLSEGFELPAAGVVWLTESDVFGARERRRITPRRVHGAQSVERLAQIQEGDFLVHAEHGIGSFGGLIKLAVGRVEHEFLLIDYARSDKLYVPISRLEKVQRYVGADQHPPALDRLGGQSWTRTRRRVQRAVVRMADELLAVIAARQALEGTAFPPPDAEYEEFEARFAYEDTPDQRRATQDVLKDLQSIRPMDRLICGDVGFGKTEVACRAAQLVTSSGRQVLFLVPTTVLCQQHLKTLTDRFRDTPVQVAALSRLSTPREVKEVREGLAKGSLDLVVGTHRLLSKDIEPRNLGLLIVDEEHRFGVGHKERIKQLRKLVDVLTLSATPIPRTLQMALTGMRDLSVILTPPPDRIAVRTEVCHFSEEVLVDAVRRELSRGGQVFLVHNRVETIDEFAGFAQRLLPEARVRVAHGQLPGPRLEEIMLSFMEREFDVLVCTAIIESGLDIPNANTMLVHRADRFGLAQLYQLRGRVGRSNRRAYCYLFLPPGGPLTRDARRRLEAIQDLSELGAGFRLASEDLEIRGAGDLLGAEQSGHIAQVGYDLYLEMLDQAVAALRGQSEEQGPEPEIRLPIAALLPETYVEDVSQRLMLYKQLSSARDDAELAEIRADLLDRYGALPPEAENLMGVIRLKIRCRRLGIVSIESKGGELQVRVTERPRLDAGVLARLLRRPGTPLRATPDRRLFLRVRQAEDTLVEAQQLLELLTMGGPVAEPGAGG